MERVKRIELDGPREKRKENRHLREKHKEGKPAMGVRDAEEER